MYREIWRRKSPLLCSCDVEVKKEQKLQEGRKVVSAKMSAGVGTWSRKQWYGCKLSGNTCKQWGRFWVYYKKLYNDLIHFIWTLKGSVSPGSAINLQFTCLHRCTEANHLQSQPLSCSQFWVCHLSPGHWASYLAFPYPRFLLYKTATVPTS